MICGVIALMRSAFTGHKDLLGLPGARADVCSVNDLRITPLIQGVHLGVYGDSYVNPWRHVPEAYEGRATLNMPAIWASEKWQSEDNIRSISLK